MRNRLRVVTRSFVASSQKKMSRRAPGTDARIGDFCFYAKRRQNHSVPQADRLHLPRRIRRSALSWRRTPGLKSPRGKMVPVWRNCRKATAARETRGVCYSTGGAGSTPALDELTWSGSGGAKGRRRKWSRFVVCGERAATAVMRGLQTKSMLDSADERENAARTHKMRIRRYVFTLQSGLRLPLPDVVEVNAVELVSPECVAQCETQAQQSSARAQTSDILVLFEWMSLRKSSLL